jgi:hypothetical protein
LNKDNKSIGGTLGGVATYASIVGGISALGNFVLNLIGWGGAAEQLFWLQILPFAAFLLAFCTIIVDYEMKRDKWPGRLKELARAVIVISTLGPESTPESGRRLIAEIYKVYHRMALAEGKKNLVKDFKTEIDRWLKGV